MHCDEVLFAALPVTSGNYKNVSKRNYPEKKSPTCLADETGNKMRRPRANNS